MQNTTFNMMSGVITHNRAILARVSELNRRAGRQAFPVMNRNGLAIWFASRLQGARRGSEVVNSDDLKLPQLNQAEVGRVLFECPDTLPLFGTEVSVDYRDGHVPQIKLNPEQVSVHAWRELDDDGVKLPSGRLVEVVVPYGYYDTIGGTDILMLKSRCMSRANKSLWENWSTDDRPEIALPDFGKEVPIMPEIVEVVYGTSVVDDTPLVAFGVVVCGNGYYYLDVFEGEWFQDRQKAEEARKEAVIKFYEVCDEVVKRKRFQTVEAEAETLQQSLRNIRYDVQQHISDDLSDRIGECAGYGVRLPDEIDGLMEWVASVKVLLTDVNLVIKTMADAEKAERIELAPVLEIVDDLETARSIRAFADLILRIERSKALQILEKEFVAPYGRARRQDAIGDNVIGLWCFEVGESFLLMGRASDVSLWLEGAIAWLETKVKPTRSKIVKVPKPYGRKKSKKSSGNKGRFRSSSGTIQDLGSLFPETEDVVVRRKRS